MIILVAVVAIIGFGTIKSTTINWTRIFYSQLKIPYGTYALKEMVSDLFPSVNRNRNSILELTDTLEHNPINLFTVSKYFNPTKLEINHILTSTEDGSNYLISAHYFSKIFVDTLGLSIDSLNMMFGYPVTSILDEGDMREYRFSIKDYLLIDTVHVRTLNPHFAGKDWYPVKERDVFSTIARLDTLTTQVLATYHGNPVVVKLRYGKGNLIVSTIPHLLSNLYLMQGGNRDFVSYLMSYLPERELVWTEFYELGRGVSTSPLRYLLGQPALKFALFLGLTGIGLFVLFEVKRKQRAIPIVMPPVNDSLQFAQTIGNLYLETRDNKSIAEKRIQFYLEFIRSQYYIKTDHLDGTFCEFLSRKSGIAIEKINSLVQKINYVKQHSKISDEVLISLSVGLDEFYANNQKN